VGMGTEPSGEGDQLDDRGIEEITRSWDSPSPAGELPSESGWPEEEEAEEAEVVGVVEDGWKGCAAVGFACSQADRVSWSTGHRSAEAEGEAEASTGGTEGCAE
jgi:hypothetical protein